MTTEKFLVLVEKLSFKSYKRHLSSKFFFKWKEKLGRRGVFCKILKENFSINSKNFSMVINTQNTYPRVRTNIGGHKFIMLDYFHELFLVTQKIFGGVSFVRFSWPHKKCDRIHVFSDLKKIQKIIKVIYFELFELEKHYSFF